MMLKKNNSFKALKINPADNVATALTDIAGGKEADAVSESKVPEMVRGAVAGAGRSSLPKIRKRTRRSL